MNWRHWIRLTVFLIFAAFMTAGPLYSQLLGGNRVMFRSWTMFAGFGLGTINARFTHVREDGTEVVLNRYELLRKAYKREHRRRPKWKSEPGAFWFMHAGTDREVLQARRLCEVVGSGSIRIDSRIATRRGWVPALKGKVIQCDGQNVTE